MSISNIEDVAAKLKAQGGSAFPLGEDNTAYAQYFTGESFTAVLTAPQSNVQVVNVTFDEGVVNHWHVHEGSGQVLVGVAGRGWYQEWGNEPQEILPGTVITILPGVKHWHGAAKNNVFQHLSIADKNCRSQWLEPVSPEVVNSLP